MHGGVTETIEQTLLSFISMAFSTFSKNSFSYISTLPQIPRRRIPFQLPLINAVKSSEPRNEKLTETNTQEISTNSQPATTASPPPKPKKPVYSSELMKSSLFTGAYVKNNTNLVVEILLTFFCFLSLAVKKGQIVSVDKEKYLNSVNVSVLFL